jgi:hypothetical protein
MLIHRRHSFNIPTIRNRKIARPPNTAFLTTQETRKDILKMKETEEDRINNDEQRITKTKNEPKGLADQEEKQSFLFVSSVMCDHFFHP